jgi:hypothetical protein
MPLRKLINDLRDESLLWDALTAGDGDDMAAVRTVFAWSYRALPERAASLFRLLGLHPGPSFSAAAVGALAGTSTGQVSRTLDDLVGAYLLDDVGADRYRFHDLLRAYAVEQARSIVESHRILATWVSRCRHLARQLKPRRRCGKPCSVSTTSGIHRRFGCMIA